MKIKNETQYNAVLERIDELLELVGDETPNDDKNFIELMLLSDLIEEYETIHYPIAQPSLTEVIKLRMFEMDLNQNALSELIGVSASRVSEYITGKSEPTLKVARKISKNLNISADIVLGV